jgi:hypothetical protein
MATQAFAGNVYTTTPDNSSGHGSYILDTLLESGNVDLTAPTSPTAVSTTVSYIARSMFFDSGGTFKFAAADGSVDTWTVLAGVQYSMQVAYVYQSGTTATGIHVIT